MDKEYGEAGVLAAVLLVFYKTVYSSIIYNPTSQKKEPAVLNFIYHLASLIHAD